MSHRRCLLHFHSLTAAALPGFVLLVDDVGGQRSLATCCAFVAFGASRACCFDIVLLARPSAVAAIQSRALPFLTCFLLEIICG